jgi:Toastrack DUF4097
MQRSVLAVLEVFAIAGVAAAALPAAAARADIVDSRVLGQTVPLDRGEAILVIVDDVAGSVRITGEDRDDIEMRATETVRGDLNADIDRARARFELKTEREPGRVAFRVRRKDGASCDCGRQGWDGYVVRYDIQLRVPRRAAVDASTVNEGDVVVTGVQGGFELKNVNGDVQLDGARGGGSVTTVNGKITVAFERAPPEPTAFKTVNGDIEVVFPADLAATLEFDTFHGDIWTDFDVEAVTRPPTTVPAPQRGFRQMSTPRPSRFRVGAGGQTHSFKTLNGDIYVRKVSK